MAQSIVMLYNVHPYHGGESVSVADGLASVLVQRGVAKYASPPANAPTAHSSVDAAHAAAWGAQDIELHKGGQTGIAFNVAHRRI